MLFWLVLIFTILTRRRLFKIFHHTIKNRLSSHVIMNSESTKIIQSNNYLIEYADGTGRPLTDSNPKSSYSTVQESINAQREPVDGSTEDNDYEFHEISSVRKRTNQSDSSSNCGEVELSSSCLKSESVVRDNIVGRARRFWAAGWNACHSAHLPHWLRDNEFLHKGHRPPLPSYPACFRSIFRVHTETGNIWTHMIGCFCFIGIAGYFLAQPSDLVHLQEKLVFSPFFIGAIFCLGFSFAFHTVHCHSEKVGRIFSKLDYCGISLMVMGSFFPWIFYGFYCHRTPKIVYMVLITVLGVFCIFVSFWAKFATPKYRPLRAALYIGLGLSGVVPALHLGIDSDFNSPVILRSLGWLLLMACLYIGGALLYAFRVPERFFPGKCDLWFQSHQIFHMFVLAAALVHYHGVTEIAAFRLSEPDCEVLKIYPHFFE